MTFRCYIAEIQIHIQLLTFCTLFFETMKLFSKQGSICDSQQSPKEINKNIDIRLSSLQGGKKQLQLNNIMIYYILHSFIVMYQGELSNCSNNITRSVFVLNKYKKRPMVQIVCIVSLVILLVYIQQQLSSLINEYFVISKTTTFFS